MAPSNLIANLTRKQLEMYKPTPQPYYTFNGSQRQLIDPDVLGAELRQDVPMDFEHVGKQHDPQTADDLRQVAAAEWVQQRFHASDLSTEYWRCGYNGVTLVDRRLTIAKVARLPLVSEYQREALVVDVIVEQPSEHEQQPEPADGNTDIQDLIRICNVHLDSMAGNPHMRPIQWKACAKYLQDRPHGVVTGILAGDCNANRAYNVTIPQENGFKDAYFELGGREDDPDGLTCGPQSMHTRFPRKRLDKVCFWQDNTDGEEVPLQLKELERIGVRVKVEDEAVGKQLSEAKYLAFVTGHYGLLADFEISDRWSLRT